MTLEARAWLSGCGHSESRRDYRWPEVRIPGASPKLLSPRCSGLGQRFHHAAVSHDVSKGSLAIVVPESVSLEREMILCVSAADRDQLNFPIIALEWLRVKIINMKLLQICSQGNILYRPPLWTESLHSPKFVRWNPNPQWGAVWEVGPWEVLGLWGWSPHEWGSRPCKRQH